MTICEVYKDDWLSEILECDSYHLRGDVLEISSKDIAHCSFIDAKVDVDDFGRIKHLEKLGFHLIDTNVQLKRKNGSYNGTGNSCRFANPGDKERIVKIAGCSFTKSRFHLDPMIKNSKADKIKSEWASNYFRGLRGDWMVIAEADGIVTGFLQLIRKSDYEIIIDLVAVDDDYRGRGLAGSMISFCDTYCVKKPVTIDVGTQISNISSLSFYQKLGFSISSAQYVFHFHK